MTAWTIASPIPVPPVSRRVVKNASKILSRFGIGYRIAVIAHRHLDGASSLVDRFQPHMFRIVTHGIVGQMRQHDQRLLAGHADRAIEAAAGVDRAGRKPAPQAADHLAPVRCARSAARLSARASSRSRWVMASRRSVSPRMFDTKFFCSIRRQIVGLALQRIQQQFGGALDRRQRRFQFVGEVGREGRDVVRAPRQLLGHVEEAVRQLGKLAGAVWASGWNASRSPRRCARRGRSARASAG